MFRTLLATAAGVALLLGCAGVSQAQEAADNDRLVIVNGNSHRVIYDDGRDDLFCVTRLYVAGYNQYGHPIYRRTMHCR
ncbi:MAG TPA: hypothetical protein VIY51_15130 [Xanthobacteraceae bacterium]